MNPDGMTNGQTKWLSGTRSPVGARDGPSGRPHQDRSRTARADIHIIVDLIHAFEYLWRAAWCLHDTGDASAEAWVARHARTLLAGGVQQTAAALKAAARAARLRGTKRKGIDDAVNYLTSKAEHLRYDTALGRS